MTAQSVLIDASKIDLQGYVTFTNLSTAGQTTINGANITTGTIDADQVKVKGSFQVRDSTDTYTRGYLGEGHGDDGVSTTDGIVLAGGSNVDPSSLSGTDNYIIVTSGGIRLQVYGNGHKYSFYLVPSGMYTQVDNNTPIPVNTAVFSA